MDKRFLLGGLVLLVLFFVSSILVSPANSGSLNPNVYTYSARLNPHTEIDYNIALANISQVTMTYNSSAPVNIYLINESAFSALSTRISMNESLLSNITALKGDGVIFAIENSTMPGSNGSRILYGLNASNTLPAGKYYLIFENSGKINVTISQITIITESIAQLTSNPALNNIALYSLIPAIILIVALGLLVWGAIGRNKKDKEGEEEKVKSIYQSYGKKERRKPPNKRTRSRKRKTRSSND
jgi:hypothetical protein